MREDGKVIGIVEEKDASEQQRAIKEVNTGFMVLPSKEMERWLGNLKNDNKQQEYYLTDLVAMAAAEGREIKLSRLRMLGKLKAPTAKFSLRLRARISAPSGERTCWRKVFVWRIRTASISADP